MSDTTGTIDYQCQCAPCQSSRAIEVLRSMPELTDDGRAALHTISDALNTLEEDAFGRWGAMNDVATAVGLDWQTATRDGILGRIKSALARVAELEAALTAQGWQPVTITAPSPNVTAELLVVGYRGDDGYWHYPDGPEGLVIRGWRPVPPPVALREPTP